jgi:hypothetical protein
MTFMDEICVTENEMDDANSVTRALNGVGNSVRRTLRGGVDPCWAQRKSVEARRARKMEQEEVLAEAARAELAKVAEAERALAELEREEAALEGTEPENARGPVRLLERTPSNPAAASFSEPWRADAPIVQDDTEPTSTETEKVRLAFGFNDDGRRETRATTAGLWEMDF